MYCMYVVTDKKSYILRTVTRYPLRQFLGRLFLWINENALSAKYIEQVYLSSALTLHTFGHFYTYMFKLRNCLLFFRYMQIKGVDPCYATQII